MLVHVENIPGYSTGTICTRQKTCKATAAPHPPSDRGWGAAHSEMAPQIWSKHSELHTHLTPQSRNPSPLSSPIRCCHRLNFPSPTRDAKVNAGRRPKRQKIWQSAADNLLQPPLVTNAGLGGRGGEFCNGGQKEFTLCAEKVDKTGTLLDSKAVQTFI